MKTKTTKHLLFIVMLQTFVHATGFSQHENLDSLRGYLANIYYSKGQKQRAEYMAKLMQDAMLFADSLIHFRPKVSLLILSPADWPRYTSFPVYGMPHFTDGQTLVVAGEDNAFWQSFIPHVEQLPAELSKEIKNTYTGSNGALSMQSFFDLLALHELGHAYHNQGDLNIQRKWMGELFCNIFLHTFIAEKKTELLAALTVFPNMVAAGGTGEFLYKSLADFETHYNEIASKFPKNYGWYQCMLHVKAREIYDAAGKNALPGLWKVLAVKENRSDEQLAAVLSTIHAVLADVLFKWNERTAN